MDHSGWGLRDPFPVTIVVSLTKLSPELSRGSLMPFREPCIPVSVLAALPSCSRQGEEFLCKIHCFPRESPSGLQPN